MRYFWLSVFSSTYLKSPCGNVEMDVRGGDCLLRAWWTELQGFKALLGRKDLGEARGAISQGNAGQAWGTAQV